MPFPFSSVAISPGVVRLNPDAPQLKITNSLTNASRLLLVQTFVDPAEDRKSLVAFR